MRREDRDPRPCGDRSACARAAVVEQPQRRLAVAGPEARDDEGTVAAVGAIRGRIRLTFPRLGETPHEAGFPLRDPVRTGVLTVDSEAVTAGHDVVRSVPAEVDRRPAGRPPRPEHCPIRGYASSPRTLIQIEGPAPPRQPSGRPSGIPTPAASAA
ncbi:enamine deaminase RidA [Streptomyces sp. WG7]|uniref:enamine deaminase RidA n=1 Tax=Streptomyces sp. WG7 TaxID=3417650 RepID=UPI003CEC1949